MFGRALEETMTLESRLGGRYIPLMVHKCVEFVRKHGERGVGMAVVVMCVGSAVYS